MRTSKIEDNIIGLETNKDIFKERMSRMEKELADHISDESLLRDIAGPVERVDGPGKLRKQVEPVIAELKTAISNLGFELMVQKVDMDDPWGLPRLIKNLERLQLKLEAIHCLHKPGEIIYQ